MILEKSLDTFQAHPGQDKVEQKLLQKQINVGLPHC